MRSCRKAPKLFTQILYILKYNMNFFRDPLCKQFSFLQTICSVSEWSPTQSFLTTFSWEFCFFSGFEMISVDFPPTKMTLYVCLVPSNNQSEIDTKSYSYFWSKSHRGGWKVETNLKPNKRPFSYFLLCRQGLKRFEKLESSVFLLLLE